MICVLGAPLNKTQLVASTCAGQDQEFIDAASLQRGD
jgi:hypothetical protein